MTVASSSGRGEERGARDETAGSLRLRRVRSSKAVGNSHALSNADTFSANPGWAAMSSTDTVSHGTVSFTFSRKAVDVTTVLISHSRIHEARVSSETW